MWVLVAVSAALQRLHTAGGAPQTFDATAAILKSLSNRQLKGVRLEIDAEWFGVDWAAGEDHSAKAVFVPSSIHHFVLDG